MGRSIGLAHGTRAVLSNGVTLFGVAALGWPVSVLLVVYWLEAGVALLRGTCQALFARRNPEYAFIPSAVPGDALTDKRGGVSVGPFPPIYPRNLKGVFAGLTVLIIFWPVGGGVVAMTVGPTVPVEPVLIAISGVVAGHAVGLADYFFTERYADVSVRSALSGRYTLSVLVFGVGGVGALLIAAVPSVVLSVVVVGKLAGDLLFDRRETDDNLTAWDESSSPVETPDNAPTATFRPDRRTLFVRAAGFGVLYLLVPPYLFTVLGAVVVGLFVGPLAGALAFGGAVVVTAVGVAARTDIKLGHLEYRVYPDQIVAYDTLLGTPQWVVEHRTVESVTIESSVLDRVRPGTPTVVVSTYGEQQRLRALERPEAFVETVAR